MLNSWVVSTYITYIDLSIFIYEYFALFSIEINFTKSYFFCFILIIVDLNKTLK